MDSPGAPILLVDDNSQILDTTARYLRARGFDVIVSDSPLGVSSIVRHCCPSLVVLDVMMPSLAGTMLASVLTSNGLVSETLIIFYSALDEEQLYAMTRKTPNATYVPKSDGLAALLAMLESRLGPNRIDGSDQVDNAG